MIKKYKLKHDKYHVLIYLNYMLV